MFFIRAAKIAFSPASIWELYLTQEELGKRISVSRQTINATEANKYVPSTVLALKIAGLFNKPVEKIFILDDGD